MARKLPVSGWYFVIIGVALLAGAIIWMASPAI
jgi:hypothetical protein